MSFLRRGEAAPILLGLGVVLLLFPSACRSPLDPELRVAVLATFDVAGERYGIFITNQETIGDIDLLKAGRSDEMIPNGLVVKGTESCNRPWSWHIDPENVHMASATIEINDGLPSMVENDVNSWAGRYYGPWLARLVSVQDYRIFRGRYVPAGDVWVSPATK